MLSRFNHLKTPDSDNLPSITRNFQLLEMEQVNTPRRLLFPLQRPFDRQFAHRCRRELESLEEPQAQGDQLPLPVNGAPRPQEYPSHRLAVPRQLFLPVWRQLFLPVHLLGLAPLLGCIGAVAGDVKLQDDGVMDHSIDGRGGGHGVGEDVFPLREDQV